MANIKKLQELMALAQLANTANAPQAQQQETQSRDDSMRMNAAMQMLGLMQAQSDAEARTSLGRDSLALDREKLAGVENQRFADIVQSLIASGQMTPDMQAAVLPQVDPRFGTAQQEMTNQAWLGAEQRLRPVIGVADADTLGALRATEDAKFPGLVDRLVAQNQPVTFPTDQQEATIRTLAGDRGVPVPVQPQPQSATNVDLGPTPALLELLKLVTPAFTPQPWR